MKTVFATAAALLLAYALVLHGARPPAAPKLQSQWQENRWLTERYVARDDAPDVVVVGTSLSRRLPLEAGGCAVNLALSGESALTGLQAVADGPHAPRVVYVEVNYPERAANAELLAHAQSWTTRWPLFQTENIPSNRLFTALWSVRERLRGGPPPAVYAAPPGGFDAVVASELPRREAEYDRLPATEVLRAQLMAWHEAVQRIEARGAQVVFFEMPVDARLESRPRAVAVRAAIQAAFPGHRFIDAAQLAGHRPLPTEDALHLRREAAQQVARRLAATWACTDAPPASPRRLQASR